MQAGSVSRRMVRCQVRLRIAIDPEDFERSENRAMIAEKFDSDTLSLHVLSIP